MSTLRNLTLTLLATSALGLCLSCGGDEKPDTADNASNSAVEGANEVVESTPTVDAAAGKTVFQTICIACHGAAGKGDGAAAAALDPKPRDLSLAEWQNSVDDAHIMKVFLEGGTSVGLSPTMVSYAGQIPDDGTRESLVAYIRSLSK